MPLPPDLRAHLEALLARHDATRTDLAPPTLRTLLDDMADALAAVLRADNRARATDGR